MADWRSYLAAQRERFLDEYLDYLRIPSVSALPEHAPDVARAARWVADRLTAAGIENARVIPTGGGGPPAGAIVYGEWLHAPGRPTALVYGHCDVQPVDPLDMWTSAPFEPRLDGNRRDGRVYARGASDNKGNFLPAVLAAEALLKTGGLPINLKFFVEGQEEIGSPQVPDVLAANRDLFACDVAISTDGGQAGSDPPALAVGCRGNTAVQIDVRGANSDLHSGSFGGMVRNPIDALAHLIVSMRGPHGRVLVEGFYDDVVELTDEDRAMVAAAGFDEAAVRRELDVPALFGEPGFSPLERVWARPTLELNGIWGGYQGEGTKTVLPAEAHAKITCRLVPNQDPARVRELIAAHVARHAPPGVTVTAGPGRVSEGARPYLTPRDHPALRAAEAVLTEVTGRAPYLARMGGTVPVYDLFKRTLGADSISFGFSVGDERIHAPDEFYRLASFDRAQRAHCLLLERLAAG